MILIHPKIFGDVGMIPPTRHGAVRFQKPWWSTVMAMIFGGASLLDLARIRKWIAMEPQQNVVFLY